VRLLLDANAFLWWRAGSRRLPIRVGDVICAPANDIVVSIVTLWEIAIKQSLGKLGFQEDFEAVMIDEDFDLLPISYRDLKALQALPLHHRDPFDRLLIAQALAEGIPIATNDPAFAAYGVQIVW